MAEAAIHGFDETSQVDARRAAIASFAFAVVYERAGERYRSTGRDLWVFSRADGVWRAVYRTMLDVSEEPL
jgi:hypothetical protein